MCIKESTGSLFLPLFFKHLAHFVRSLWWKPISTGIKSVETVPAILLHPFSPCSDTVPPNTDLPGGPQWWSGAGRCPGGRWASDSLPEKWEPSSAPSGVWLDRCSLEGPRGVPLYSLSLLSLRVDPRTEGVSSFQVAVLWKPDLVNKLHSELEIYVPGHL